MSAEVPSTYRKLMVKTLTSKFREAVTINTVTICKPKEGEVCVRNKYVGVNATDVNISAGRYFVEGDPPYDLGFEGVGEICCVGGNVNNLKVGQNVAYFCHLKAYAEYVCLSAAEVFPIPEAKPEYLALLVCGLTASIGLDKVGKITEGDTVLITAAAGGTGHIAVQWAKAAGCHVIGTCSSDEKGKFLKTIGCDRVINYVKEDISEVLKKEYPSGVDVVWETIGGKVFEDCLKNLAIKGRLVVVGMISGYKAETKSMAPQMSLAYLPELLLTKSAAVQGFLLTSFAESIPTYVKHLFERFHKEDLKIVVDGGKESKGKEFFGMEGIIQGVEHLHSGKSSGKVVVRIS